MSALPSALWSLRRVAQESFWPHRERQLRPRIQTASRRSSTTTTTSATATSTEIPTPTWSSGCRTQRRRALRARARDVAHAFPRHLDPQRAAVAYLHRRTEPVTRLRDAGHAPRLLRHRDLGRDGLRDIVGGVDVERLAPCRRCEWGK